MKKLCDKSFLLHLIDNSDDLGNNDYFNEKTFLFKSNSSKLIKYNYKITVLGKFTSLRREGSYRYEYLPDNLYCFNKERN